MRPDTLEAAGGSARASMILPSAESGVGGRPVVAPNGRRADRRSTRQFVWTVL
jgi:hypothetical protein